LSPTCRIQCQQDEVDLEEGELQYEVGDEYDWAGEAAMQQNG
jgi:hypothetical protein